MSSNVLGIRRFGQVIGQCVALTPAQTVGGGWRGSERSDRPSQPEPRGALAPMRIPFVKCRLSVNHYYNKCFTLSYNYKPIN